MAENKRHEVRVTGFGGQGVILCGHIIGKAAALFDHKFSTMTQSFGPEARGSACSSQVIIEPEHVEYPYVTRPNILIAMSQDAFNKYLPEIADDALILYDSSLVTIEKLPSDKQTAYGIPATKIAEELGRRIVLNIVMLGFFSAIADVLSQRAMRKAVLKSVPKGTEEFNMRAFSEGLDYGLKLKRRLQKNNSGNDKTKVKSK
ncbi:MAG: 2-oxoacid:acceptor oxidoreductase family protein [Planctomycetota bacterium]|jgi:2-oxoglutarate ferredoxin oxidoreductase subunit gamma